MFLNVIRWEGRRHPWNKRPRSYLFGRKMAGGPCGKEEFSPYSVSDPSLRECLQIPWQSRDKVSRPHFLLLPLAACSFVADWSFQPVLGSEYPFLRGTNLVRAAGCSQTMEEWKLQRPPILIYVSQLVFSNPQQSFVWMIRGWGGQCATQGRGRPAVSCVSKLSRQIRVLPCVIATWILTEWLAKRYGQ